MLLNRLWLAVKKEHTYKYIYTDTIRLDEYYNMAAFYITVRVWPEFAGT